MPVTTAASQRKAQHSPAVMEQLATEARAILQRDFADCTLQDNRADYPKFDGSEVKIGKLLGTGGFSSVFEVQAFLVQGATAAAAPKKRASNNQEDADYEDFEIDGRQGGGGSDERVFLAQHCIRGNGDARYCLKRLNPDVVANQDSLLRGMIDLATETHILSDIVHTNIVKLRAFAKTDAGDNNDSFTESYFIIMDRLYDTLETRIYKKWQKTSKFQKSAVGKVFDMKGKKKTKLLEDRLMYAYDLSSAIHYLHERNIIYRDMVRIGVVVLGWLWFYFLIMGFFLLGLSCFCLSHTSK